jgi:hypothetical protein
MKSQLNCAANAASTRARGGWMAMVALVGMSLVACGGGKASPPSTNTARAGGASGIDGGAAGGRAGGAGGSSGSGGVTQVPGGFGGSGGSTAAAGGSGGTTTTPDALPPSGNEDVAPTPDTAPVVDMAPPVEVGPPPALCGNGKVEDGEDCDQGAMNSATAYGKDKCLSTCQKAPFCGDSETNRSRGEDCDKGAANADRPYGIPGDCSATCKPIGYCGDMRVQMPQEACDEGMDRAPAIGRAGCRACQVVAALPECGNGRVETGEDCDEGTRNIVGDYSPRPAVPPAKLCNRTCKLITKFCGDNAVEAGKETCDAGPTGKEATTLVEGCTAACVIIPKKKPECGNGIPEAGETCDQGPKNLTTDWALVKAPAGMTFCSDECTVVTKYCGDKDIHLPEEQCDLGVDNGKPSLPGQMGCSSTCKNTPPPAPMCGDGHLDVNEECDKGAANTDTPAYNVIACAKSCKNIRLFCGDGKRNGPEKCDGAEGVPAGEKCKADCSGPEPVAQSTSVPVTSYTGLNCAAGVSATACRSDLNTPEGVGLDPSCGPTGNNELVFGPLGGKPEGPVIVTITGLGFGADVTCGAAKTPVPANRQLPEGCYDKNQTIRVQFQIKADGVACSKITYAVVKASILPL